MSIPSTKSSTDERPIAVLKVGGSLFDLPELGARLRELLATLDAYRICLVSGGGASADVVRKLQPVHGLSDSDAHRLAMESLRVGEHLLLGLVPNAALSRSSTEVGGLAVIQVVEFVASEAGNAEPLEENWRVTSDSIAAWVATVLGAVRLILLKSTAAPGDGTHPVASAEELDDAFGKYSADIPEIVWCNLRQGLELVPVRRA